MPWIPRPEIAAALRRALLEPGPAVAVVRGPPGSGKSAILRSVLADLAGSDAPGPRREIIAIVGTPGLAARRRQAFDADVTERAGVEGGEPTSASLQPPTVPPATPRARAGAGDSHPWIASFDALLRAIERRRRPWVLVLDELAPLLTAEPELGAALSHLWTGARARGLPLHLVLVAEPGGPLDGLLSDDGPLAGAHPHPVRVEAVSATEVREHLPHWSAHDRMLLQCWLGSAPGVLGHVDPDLRLATNLQRLVLDPTGPLHDLPIRHLRERLQKPDRYAGLLAALAGGAREWGRIHAANPAFASGNQVAPYLKTLHDLGWIDVDLSLDASPRSRRRRYHLTDPFSGFWFQVVEPLLGDLLAGASPSQLWRARGRGAAYAYAASVFPLACRRAVRERAADLFRVDARTIGGLWGDEYDLPVSGTLANGAALYGLCVFGRPATVADADAAHRSMRATRYGFGRQARLRVLFAADGCTEALVRRAARDELLTLVESDALF